MVNIISMSSLAKSYLPRFGKVSQSRTGQMMSILKLSPGRQGEGKSQLIHRQGLEDRKFPHQLCFGDALDGHLNGVLTPFRLTKQGHGTRIKADSHTAVGKALAQVVVRGS